MEPLTYISIGVAIAAALFGLGRLFAAWQPIFEKFRNAKILEEKLKHGPFDKNTIINATRYFIRPKSQNIDPAQELELRHALAATREDLISKIDHFIFEDTTSKHLFILADSGTGKTTFMLNYFAYNENKKNKYKAKIAMYPLGFQDVDEWISKIDNKEEIILFLDALDEDTKAVPDHKKRISELMLLCEKFKKVIITCRTQFFPKDEEIPVETGTIRVGPCKAGDSKCYCFRKIYLSPFDDDDIRSYIKLIHPFYHFIKREKCLRVALSIPNLAVRPMLLAYIPDIVHQNKATAKIIDLYEIMIDAWCKRESSWIRPSDMMNISGMLAVDIYTNRESRQMERVSYAELVAILPQISQDMPSWKISSRSLLNRDALGNFKFAHRSIMEYLFVKELINKNVKCENVSLTDQMKDFLFEYLDHHKCLSKKTKAHIRDCDICVSRDILDYFRKLNDLSAQLFTYSNGKIDISFSANPQKTKGEDLHIRISIKGFDISWSELEPLLKTSKYINIFSFISRTSASLTLTDHLPKYHTKQIVTADSKFSTITQTIDHGKDHRTYEISTRYYYPNSDVEFYYVTISKPLFSSSSTIDRVLHIISEDDQRFATMSTLLNQLNIKAFVDDSNYKFYI